MDDDAEKRWRKPGLWIKEMQLTSAQEVENMIKLVDVHEDGILNILLTRYNNNQIYTYIGPILVAVNPYQRLPIYTLEKVRY